MSAENRFTKIDTKKFGPWAIVTGASQGLGQEFARQLAANNLNLVLVSRRMDALKKVGEDLKQRYNINYRAIEADLSTRQGQEHVMASCDDLDIGLLISNAGTGQPGNYLSFEPEVIRSIAELNGVSYMILVHHFGRQFAKRGRGGALLISALGSDVGVPYNSVAAAPKGLINTLGKSLHYEFKKLGLNLTVLIVPPTETPVIDHMGLRRQDMPTKPRPASRTVSDGLTALQANKMIYLPGAMFRIMSRVMPEGFVRAMTASMMKKSTKFVA